MVHYIEVKTKEGNSLINWDNVLIISKLPDRLDIIMRDGYHCELRDVDLSYIREQLSKKR